MAVRDVERHWNARLSSVRRLRTPAHYYDADRAIANLQSLQRAVTADVHLFLSLKANPHLELNRRILAATQCGLDLSGLGEVALAKALGPLGPVSLVGPGKTSALLEEAMAIPATQIVLESVREVDRFVEIPRRQASPATLLRINRAEVVRGANETMAGIPSQFGVDEEDADAAVEHCRARGLDLDGLHFYGGSQIRSTQLAVDGIRIAAKAALEVAARNGLGLRCVSLGGGLGVPLSPTDEEVDLELLSRDLRPLWEQIRAEHHEVDLQMEVGRYVYADAGAYVTRIVEVKRSRGQSIVIVENGISGFGRPAVRWGETHPIWKLGDAHLVDGSRGITCRVVGPTCLPGDLLADACVLDAPKEGDVLVVGSTGAYGLTMSLGSWGSLPPVEEVLLP